MFTDKWTLSLVSQLFSLDDSSTLKTFNIPFIIILKNIRGKFHSQCRTSASQEWANSIPFSNTQADLPLLVINIVVVPLSFIFTLIYLGQKQKQIWWNLRLILVTHAQENYQSEESHLVPVRRLLPN